jgi:hypothetical protein
MVALQRRLSYALPSSELVCSLWMSCSYVVCLIPSSPCLTHVSNPDLPTLGCLGTLVGYHSCPNPQYHPQSGLWHHNRRLFCRCARRRYPIPPTQSFSHRLVLLARHYDHFLHWSVPTCCFYTRRPLTSSYRIDCHENLPQLNVSLIQQQPIHATGMDHRRIGCYLHVRVPTDLVVDASLI